MKMASINDSLENEDNPNSDLTETQWNEIKRAKSVFEKLSKKLTHHPILNLIKAADNTF